MADLTSVSLVEGTKVKVTPVNGEAFEGKVEMATEQGLIVKPKGKTSTLFFEADEIESVSVVDEQSKPLVPVRLKMINLGSARSHLLHRHGYTLAEVNDLTDEAALDIHNKTDHSVLGHVHVVEKVKK